MADPGLLLLEEREPDPSLTTLAADRLAEYTGTWSFPAPPLGLPALTSIEISAGEGHLVAFSSRSGTFALYLQPDGSLIQEDSRRRYLAVRDDTGAFTGITDTTALVKAAVIAAAGGEPGRAATIMAAAAHEELPLVEAGRAIIELLGGRSAPAEQALRKLTEKTKQVEGAVNRIGYMLLGVADASSGEPVTQETLFEAASLSKPVCAAIALRLAERGELDLDRPLPDYLPYERVDHDPRSRALTARIVISHRTGLPNWGGEQLELGFYPGAAFSYSGEGFVYLQRVLEKLSGLSLDELARREIFSPLGMTHSRFSWAEGEEIPLAMPHDEIGQRQQKRQAHEANAAASLHTTAADYARFVTMSRDTVLRGRMSTVLLCSSGHIFPSAEDRASYYAYHGPGTCLAPASKPFVHWSGVC